MISILIVDDDLTKITNIIISIRRDYDESVEIKQASCVTEALELLQYSDFHLLITDLCMPYKQNDAINNKGGEILIKEIYKKRNRCKVPIYIVGLSQFESVINNFSSVWQVWHYDSGSEEWRIKLRDLIFHISKVNSKIVSSKKETVFVEGTSDKIAINLALKLFVPEIYMNIAIETISFGGGASWVERQLIIWGKTLFWKVKNQTYLKSVGILDNDDAGQRAIQAVRKQIEVNSAESKTFNILKYETKYADHLIQVAKAGINIDITLEEMYAPFCWGHALNEGWLTKRVLSEACLKNPDKWDKLTSSLKDHLDALNLSDDVNLYTFYKVNEDCKIKFSNYVKSLTSETQVKAMYAFAGLVADISKKLYTS